MPTLHAKPFELDAYNSAMTYPECIQAYKLLSMVASLEYKSQRGMLSFLILCQDACIAHKRWNWKQEYWIKLRNRTTHRPRTRAAMLAWFAVMGKRQRDFRIEGHRHG